MYRLQSLMLFSIETGTWALFNLHVIGKEREQGTIGHREEHLNWSGTFYKDKSSLFMQIFPNPSITLSSNVFINAMFSCFLLLCLNLNFNHSRAGAFCIIFLFLISHYLKKTWASQFWNQLLSFWVHLASPLPPWWLMFTNEGAIYKKK